MTGARTQTFEKLEEDVFKIAVKEKAERNAANERVCELIARHFGVPVKAVQIRTGQHRKNKSIEVIV